MSPLLELVGIVDSSDVYTLPSTETILVVNVVPEQDTVASFTVWLRISMSPDSQPTKLVPLQSVLATPVLSFTEQTATTCRLPGHTEVGQLLIPRAMNIDYKIGYKPIKD